MTDFVLSAVQDAAQRAIEQTEDMCHSLANQECFAQALLSPPAPVPALERAFSRRCKLLRAEWPAYGSILSCLIKHMTALVSIAAQSRWIDICASKPLRTFAAAGFAAMTDSPVNRSLPLAAIHQSWTLGCPVNNLRHLSTMLNWLSVSNTLLVPSYSLKTGLWLFNIVTGQR